MRVSERAHILIGFLIGGGAVGLQRAEEVEGALVLAGAVAVEQRHVVRADVGVQPVAEHLVKVAQRLLR